jgi:signal transduction histidine kinase/putative methionine-R-sulfoxide reductase with GAF domain
MAMEVTSAKYGIFRLVDASGAFLITRAYAGDNLGHPHVEALSIESASVSAWVAKNRQSVCISDLQAEPWSRIYFPLDADLQMRAELAAPLISASGRLEGVINLESPLPNAFDEEDRHLLQSLATQAVIAIQEVRLLDALQEIAQLLLTQPEKTVLRRLVVLANELLNAKASSIWILDGSEVILRAATAVANEGERIPLDGSLPGIAVAGQTTASVDRVMAQTFAWQPDLSGVESNSRALAIPLADQPGSSPVGAFCVYGLVDAVGQGGGTEWESKILTCLAHYAALAIYNSRHLQALQDAQEQHAVAEMFAAVGDIATNLLHQLNNKIGTIPVRVQGIQDKSKETLAKDRYLANNLAEIEHSATEAMESVRKNLSHLHPVRRVPVNLATCVRSSLTNAKINPAVLVRVEGLDDLPSVAAAQQNLVLVFTNLFENADHAMQGKGRILVQGNQRGNWVEVSVSDSGPGIPPEIHNRIFELSYSGSTGASQPGKLGFGLWWVKTQIVRLGGTVSVESDGLQGTTFRIRLPAGGSEG